MGKMQEESQRKGRKQWEEGKGWEMNENMENMEEGTAVKMRERRKC